MKLDQLNNDLERRLSSIQQSFAADIERRYLSQLEVDNDMIKFSERNLLAAPEIEKIVNDYAKKLTPVFKWYAKQLFDIVGSQSKAFTKLGSVEQLNAAQASINGILQKFGIDGTGKVIPGGFLAKVSNLTAIQQSVINFMLKEIAVGRSYGELLKGFHAFMGKETTGKFLNHFKTELFDTTNRMLQAVKNSYANSMSLNYFRYSGSLMDSSREFCQERAGNVYHRSDVDKWPKDLPYFQPQYDFFEDRGGYNCRHEIIWLSNEQGSKLYENTTAASSL